jgi:hypothetical protein
MIRISLWLAVLTVPLLLWHECGEDIGVFCYRIGLGAFTSFRSRALVPVPVRNSVHSIAARNNAECSTISFTSSVRSTAPKEFNS